ncbi:MAG: hypothetical protein PF636_05655 [Actinomycetota bacterium]|nr:hypothetical protein [Actinomycetota bacterium]
MMLGADFTRLFAPDGLAKDLEDYNHYKKEWILAHLLMNRASVRMSQAMKDIEASSQDRKNGIIDYKPFEEHALAARYISAARNRIDVFNELIDELVEKRRVERRLARIRTMMLEHGYWSPYRGDKPPSIEDAPAWILKAVEE